MRIVLRSFSGRNWVGSIIRALQGGAVVRLRVIIPAIAAVSLFLCSCGSSVTDNQQSIETPGFGFPPIPQRISGSGMPAAAPDDFSISDDGHQTSTVYAKFFADSVNASSGPRWN